MPDIVLLRIRAGKENERGPLYAEPALSALHSLEGEDERIGLEIGVAEGKIGLFVRGAEGGLQLAESQLYAQYPDIDIERLIHDPFQTKEGEEVFSVDLQLNDPEVFPIKRHPQFDDILSRVNVDSIASITSSLARYKIPGMRGHVQIIMAPMDTDYRRRAVRFLPLLGSGIAGASESYARFFTRVQLARGWRRAAYLPIAILMGGFKAWPGFRTFGGPAAGADEGDTAEEMEKATARSHDKEDSVGAALDKVNRLVFVCNVRVSVIAPKGNEANALRKLNEIVGTFTQFALPLCQEFAVGKVQKVHAIDYGFRTYPYVLSVEEIATLWHLPTILVQTPNIDWVLSRKLEPPIDLPVIQNEEDKESITALGEAVYRGERTRFGIRPDDRRRHIYVIGKTGMGKSTLLENMIFSDIHAGKGVGVIDPHGDLIEAILQFIPKQRSNDVVLFDPADREFPISFNILECRDAHQRDLVASGIMSVFLKMWPDAWSGRMEHIMRNTLLALLENEGTSLLGVMRMFADDHYRRKIVSRVRNPMVRSFWESEYAQWSSNYRTEAVSAIQNKVGQLLSTPLLRNIVGQVTSTLDLRHAMDSSKIILVNLSKGRTGEDMSAFLGSMLVTKFQIEAMSRVDIPEKERRDFYLYVDEFQNFATESFATILSEARKYRLSLTMANQYVGQLLVDGKTTLRDAVFGNVGTLINFQIGSDDAEVFSLQFEEMVMPKDILSLPKYHAYMRLMIDGMPSKPFSVQTLPPPDFEQDANRVEILRRMSRQRYSAKREEIEDKISKWAASAAEGREHNVNGEKQKEKEQEERKKAQKKGMSVEEYRAWRDREMWTNDYNALRKRVLLNEELTEEEKKSLEQLVQNLERSGGIPPPSKAMQELEKRKKDKQK